MPFERYLAAASPQDPHPRYDHYSPDHDDRSGVDPSTFSTNVQFQLPHLMLAAPTLAPGGGAEVLPPAFLASSAAAASSWLANSPYYAHPDHFSSASAPLKQHAAHQHVVQSPYPPSAHLRSYSRAELSHSSAQLHNPYLAPSPPSAESFPLPLSPPSDLNPSSSHSSATAVSVSSFTSSMPLTVPSALGLPVYSASGFDLLSILCRVAARPYPKIMLGPVDMTCSFVVVDIRRYDAPIVYASPTFCNLTGYDEHEVIGRNCRFLQSPDGRLQRGEQRCHTAPEAVSYLKRCLVADKECQTSMINYRKGGAAFINLVTVIPLSGGINNTPQEADEIAYHVGFQVDLTQQPNAILQKLRDGSYIVDYSRKLSTLHSITTGSSPRDWRTSSASMSGVSSDMRALLADPAFVNSIPLSLSASLSASPAAGERVDPYDGNKPLHLFLLESTPDFVHVMSLKGAFLYVAPAVHRVLGYDPEELVGKSIAEFCHPADVVPLMRELKESSVTSVNPGLAQYPSGDGASPDTQTPYVHGQPGRPRTVDLLFRMQAKAGEYVWVECRGRLHVEPGKGRKAIILSGRVRHIPQLHWGLVERAGGLEAPAPSASVRQSPVGSEDDRAEAEREFWGLLSGSGAFLFVGAAVRDVLGWGAGEVIGRTFGDLIGGPAMADARRAVEAEIARALAAGTRGDTRQLPCEMKRKDGGTAVVCIVLYPSQDYNGAGSAQGAWPASPPKRPVVCQVKLMDPSVSGPQAARVVHPLGESVFTELQITRGTSWQYELQQLKFANQRLLEEVAALEASVRSEVDREDHRDQAYHQDRVRRQSFSQGELVYSEEHRDVRYSVADRAQDWGVQYAHYQEPVQGPLSRMTPLPTKRSWAAYTSGDGPPV